MARPPPNLRCLLRRLKRRRIKNIDAQMVQCGCPSTYALQKKRMIGRHLDRELGSERAAVNSVWKRSLGESAALKPSAKRNLRKVGCTRTWSARESVGGDGTWQDETMQMIVIERAQD